MDYVLHYLEWMYWELEVVKLPVTPYISVLVRGFCQCIHWYGDSYTVNSKKSPAPPDNHDSFNISNDHQTFSDNAIIITHISAPVFN